METKRSLVISLAILIGLAVNAWFLGRALQRFRVEDRSISVKGFSEREVKSDLAVWTIRTRVANNDLSEGSRAIEVAKNTVISFLIKNGIKQEEIIQKDLIVNDKMAQEYGSSQLGDSYRFIIDKSIQVRSVDVDNIQKVSRMTDDLLKAGVVISNAGEYGAGPVKYIFTRLNDIKPEMLAEATRNAKNAAVQFTMESNTRLGGLKKANQGFFSIIDRDNHMSGQTDGGYYGSGTSDIYKIVRVVVSVEYSIN